MQLSTQTKINFRTLAAQHIEEAGAAMTRAGGEDHIDVMLEAAAVNLSVLVALKIERDRKAVA